jgi:hypothetical protein
VSSIVVRISPQKIYLFIWAGVVALGFIYAIFLVVRGFVREWKKLRKPEKIIEMDTGRHSNVPDLDAYCALIVEDEPNKFRVIAVVKPFSINYGPRRSLH